MPPQPDGISRLIALGDTGLVDRMGFKQSVGFGSKVLKNFSAITIRQKGRHCLPANIMGRGKVQLISAAMPDHEMAIGNTGIKGEIIIAKFLLQGSDKLSCLF